MKEVTLCFLVREGEVLLAMKKRGFGMGKWNGVGGKIEKSETPEEAARREVQEEVGVVLQSLEKVAMLDFYFIDDGQDDLRCHAFVARSWRGKPQETEEMRPRWFAHDAIPYEAMWEDERHWLPLVLEGKRLQASFTFAGDDKIEKLQDMVVEEI